MMFFATQLLLGTSSVTVDICISVSLKNAVCVLVEMF